MMPREDRGSLDLSGIQHHDGVFHDRFERPDVVW
jgi:hypothetical protein